MKAHAIHLFTVISFFFLAIFSVRIDNFIIFEIELEFGTEERMEVGKEMEVGRKMDGK